MGLGRLPERPALARLTAYRPAYHRPGPLGTLHISEFPEPTMDEFAAAMDEFTVVMGGTPVGA